MNQTITDLKNEITKSLERLQTLRDEARVRLHLAGMDAKDRWNELDPYVAEAERAAQQFSESSRATLTSAIERVEQFLSSLNK